MNGKTQGARACWSVCVGRSEEMSVGASGFCWEESFQMQRVAEGKGQVQALLVSRGEGTRDRNWQARTEKGSDVSPWTRATAC